MGWLHTTPFRYPPLNCGLSYLLRRFGVAGRELVDGGDNDEEGKLAEGVAWTPAAEPTNSKREATVSVWTEKGKCQEVTLQRVLYKKQSEDVSTSLQINHKGR